MSWLARRSRGALGAAALVAALLVAIVSPAHAEEAGSFTRHTYASPHGARDYMLYVPSALLAPDEEPGLPDPEPNPEPIPVVVYLHGCNQTAPDAALGTEWNAEAEEHGFIVVYPEQTPSANGARCWNWFLPEHQVRDSGEAAIIAGITSTVVSGRYGARGRFTGDTTRTYILGASAGGVMTTNMAVAYPDLYAAIGVLAGCPYLSCSDDSGSMAYAEMGERARTIPTIIFQGTLDVVVNYPLGRSVLYQWLGTNDLADDGERNASVSLQPEVEQRGVDQGIQPGSGDLCIPPPSSLPCAGGVLGLPSYPSTIERYRGAGGKVVVEFWAIHGLNHAYAGGNPQGSFVDPMGPDLTSEAWDFFSSRMLEPSFGTDIKSGR
jgi:poly(hydroxyalkanoate) depolymerase family esterase